MTRRKVILGMFIGMLMISAGIIGVLYLRGGEDNLIPEPSDDYEVTIYDLTLEEMGLTEKQYQLLVDSIMPEALEQMNAIRRRNAWLMLDFMTEIEFVDGSPPGHSRVGFATWILDVLDVGEIREITPVRVIRAIDESTDSPSDSLLIRILNEEDNVYYLWYPRSSLLARVTRDNEDGEILYESQIHVVRDGRLCEREYARGPIISCRE